ncbi:uncharacterized protein LOC129587883, partial [Paramacrobiotus metropolitanus]|uniref:uncharacterized protein LOC129587883 n=1 Tax=Paramacrobiotus metropolitanus TaxID=2943436 RepID=UPI002445F75B
MFEPGELGSERTPTPNDEVFDTTKVSRPNSADGFFTTPVKSNQDDLTYQASTLEYTAEKWIAATPPERIVDVDLLRSRCRRLITQIALADRIIDSAGKSLRNSEDTHRLERSKWEREMADANKGIAIQQREIDRLNAILKRTDQPCRHDIDEATTLKGMLDRSMDAVHELNRELAEANKALEEAQKDLADVQTALVESEQAAGAYVVELKKADDEIDRLTHRVDELEAEIELAFTRMGRRFIDANARDMGFPNERTADVDLKLRAQLEYNLNEAQKVNEAQHSRILYLEAREVELYDFGEQAARNLTDMMRQMDEMDIETRCLREEKKHLEQSQVELPPYQEHSRVEPPSYRTSMAQEQHPSRTISDILWGINPTQEMAPRQNRAPPPQQYEGQPQQPRHADQAQARHPQQDGYEGQDDDAYQQEAYEDQQGHMPYVNPPPAPAAQQAAPAAQPNPLEQNPAHVAL